MLSMYYNLAKQYVSSINLFYSFNLLLKFGITDVSSSTMSMLASTGPIGEPIASRSAWMWLSLLNVKLAICAAN